MKVLEKSQIAPPPSSAPTTSLPFTFFDVLWLISSPVKRLFFFHYSHSNHHFHQTIVPNLKHSLSLALQRFYPFAGNLRRSSDQIPDIFYADGDSVTLTVVESDPGDFDYLTGCQPRNARDFDPLVPALEPKSADPLLSPLMALQVTLFPNSGICIAVTASHVVADGKITTQFIKFWASICRFGEDQTTMEQSSSLLPFYDRTVIKDPKGLLISHLNQLQEVQKIMESYIATNNTHVTAAAAPVDDDKVFGTFVMGRPEIEKLKKWVIKKKNITRDSNSAFRVSTFVVTCAYVWVCLVKSQISSDDDQGNKKKKNKVGFGLIVDCRDRLNPPIPKMYFGNCLLPSVTEPSYSKSELTGEDGIAVAAEAIGKAVQIMNSESGLMAKAESYVRDVVDGIASETRYATVAGSPKFKVYETDFGWGKPKKVELVSIKDGEVISVCESRDEEEGGVEVGLSLSKLEMDVFASLFENNLKVLA